MIQQKHHYIPVFYLQRWTSGRDKKLRYNHKSSHGKIAEKRVSPKHTAFEDNLNALKGGFLSGVDESNMQIVERELEKLDSDAAAVLTKMLDKGVSALSVAEKNTWLNFVLLLLERTPDRIDKIETLGDKNAMDIVHSASKKWGNKPTWIESYDLLQESNFTYNYARVRLYDFIKNKAYTRGENCEEWTIIDASKSPLEFYTSNRPVIVDVQKSMQQEYSLLELALTPKKLWICAPKGFALDKELIKLLIITFNMRLLALRPKYVYSYNPIVDEVNVKYRRALEYFLSE